MRRYHEGAVVNHSPDVGKVVVRPARGWGSSLLVGATTCTDSHIHLVHVNI